MSKHLVLLLPLLLLACSSQKPSATAAQPASNGTTVIHHARIFGHDGKDALEIVAGKITRVGSSQELTASPPAGASMVDAKGGWLLPGFHDSHVHMMGGGMADTGVNVEQHQTLEATLNAIKTWAAAHPGEPWVMGRGWQYGIVPEGQFPTRQQLDSVVPDRPAFLRSYDGHSGWANTKALQAAGLTTTTPEPEGGRIVREADGKTPAGALLEGAQFAMSKAAPAPTPETQMAALESALRQLSNAGFTSVEEIGFDPGEFELLSRLEKAGRLPLRVRLSLGLQGDLALYEKLRAQYTSPMLRFGFLKGFNDGVIESRTAFMLKPYEGSTETGKPLIAPDELKRLVTAAHAKGFAVALHSIGDGAVRLALDAFEAAIKANPGITVRHRVEHIEVLDPADAARFKALGVVASMQPYHANPGGPAPDDGVWSKNLGPSRLPMTFAWRTIQDAGGVLAFGTDWPVMSANPLWGLAMATTRKDPNGQPPNGWNAHQTITMDQAVKAYTWGSAWAANEETEVGSLAAGQWGDVVVLSPEADLAAPASMWTAKVAHVVVGGVPKAITP